MLERCERKTLLGWKLLELPNRVNVVCQYYYVNVDVELLVYSSEQSF